MLDSRIVRLAIKELDTKRQAPLMDMLALVNELIDALQPIRLKLRERLGVYRHLEEQMRLDLSQSEG